MDSLKAQIAKDLILLQKAWDSLKVEYDNQLFYHKGRAIYLFTRDFSPKY